MMPFCGYNMADHWSHWLKVGNDLRAAGNMPRIFQVNWFRKDENGDFLWPGFAENSRVLEWILDRVDGQATASDTPLGYTPSAGALNVDGLDLSEAQLEQLFAADPEAWLAELDDTERFFARFGDKLPAALSAQLAELRARFSQ
jgi:phosphoenolpyruvate carboxykinase (GTP)